MQVGVKMATGREVSGLEASQAEIVLCPSAILVDRRHQQRSALTAYL